MRRSDRRWAWPVVVLLLATPALPAAPPKAQAGAVLGSGVGACAGSLTGAAVGAPAKKPAAHAAVRATVVQELTAILNETDSAETFVVTAMALEKMGAAARPAVPAIVRNAERLGVLKGLFQGDGHGKKAERAEVVMKAIETILQKPGGASGRGCCYPAADPLLRGSPPAPVVPAPSAPCPPPPPPGPFSPTY